MDCFLQLTLAGTLSPDSALWVTYQVYLSHCIYTDFYSFKIALHWEKLTQVCLENYVVLFYNDQKYFSPWPLHCPAHSIIYCIEKRTLVGSWENGRELYLVSVKLDQSKIFTKGKTIKQIGPQDSMILSSYTGKYLAQRFLFSLLQHLSMNYTAFPFLKLLLLINLVVNSLYLFLYLW